jgi:NADH dehydrogenase
MNNHDTKPRVIVTGASGYIGQRLLEVLLNAGLNVVAFVRNPQCIRHKNVVTYLYRIENTLNRSALEGISAVIHLAAFTTNRDKRSEEIELKAIRELLEASKDASIEKFIFISSQSAKPESPTTYGQSKWLMEQEVKKWGGIIVRPGLVYGGREQRGLFAILCKIVQIFPIIPNLHPAPLVQPVHVDDLCSVLLSIITNSYDRLEFNIGSPNPIGFTDFLRALAWYRFHRYLWSIPVPSAFVYHITNILKYFKLISRYGSDRIFGLLSLPQMDTKASLSALDLNLRPLGESLDKCHSACRQVLVEGRTLMKYVSGRKPNVSELRRYAKMIKLLRNSKAMGLRSFFLTFPFTLRLIDPKLPIMPLLQDQRNELVWRMDAALVISEATPHTVKMFTAINHIQAVCSFFWLCLCFILLEIPLNIVMVALRIALRFKLVRRFKINHEF